MFGAEPINPVAPDVPNMFWAAVFFLLLLVLMYTVCLPPVRKAMRQREEQQRLDAEAAERADQASEQVRRDYDATLADARALAALIVDEARNEADVERVRQVSDVENEINAARAELMVELDAQRVAALDGMKGDVAALAVQAASKVVQRELDISASQSIVDDYVASATRR